MRTSKNNKSKHKYEMQESKRDKETQDLFPEVRNHHKGETYVSVEVLTKSRVTPSTLILPKLPTKV